MLTNTENIKVQTSDFEVSEEIDNQQKNTVSLNCSTETQELESYDCGPTLSPPLYHVKNCSTEGENLPIRNQPVVFEAPSAFQICNTDEDSKIVSEKQHGFLTGWSICNFPAFIWMAIYAFQCFVLNAWRYIFRKRSEANHRFSTKEKYRLGDAVNLEEVFGGSINKKFEAHKKLLRAPLPIDNMLYLEHFVPLSDIRNKNIGSFRRVLSLDSRSCRPHSMPFLNNRSTEPNRPNTGNRGATTRSNFDPSLTANHSFHRCLSLPNLNNIGAKSHQSTVTIANNNGDGPINQPNNTVASGPSWEAIGSSHKVEQQETAVGLTDCHGNGEVSTVLPETCGRGSSLAATGNSQEVQLQSSCDLVLGVAVEGSDIIDNRSGMTGGCSNKSGTGNYGCEGTSMVMTKDGISEAASAPPANKNGGICHHGGNGNQPKETKNPPANNKSHAASSSGFENNQAHGGGGEAAAGGGTGNGGGDDGDRGHDKKKKTDNLNNIEDEKQEDENEDEDDAKTEKNQPGDQAMPDISHTDPGPLPAETDRDGSENRSQYMSLDNSSTTKDENLEEDDVEPEKTQQEVPTGQLPTEKDDGCGDYHSQYMNLDNSEENERNADKIISAMKGEKERDDMNTEKAQLHRDHDHHSKRVERRAGYKPATIDQASTTLPTELSSALVTDAHPTTLEGCILIGSTCKNPGFEPVTMDQASTALPTELSSTPVREQHSTTPEGCISIGSTWEKTQLKDSTDQSRTNNKDDAGADYQSPQTKRDNPEEGEEDENKGVKKSTPADQASSDESEDNSLCEDKQKSENPTRLEMEEPEMTACLKTDGEPVLQPDLNVSASDKISTVAKVDGSDGAKVDHKNQKIDNLGNLEDENITSSDISPTGVDDEQCDDNQNGHTNPSMAGKQEKDADYIQSAVTQTTLSAAKDQAIPAINKSAAKKNVSGDQGDEKNLKMALLADKGQKQEVANGNDSVKAGSNEQQRQFSYDLTSDGIGRTDALNSNDSINDAPNNVTLFRGNPDEDSDRGDAQVEPKMFQLQNLTDGKGEKNQTQAREQIGRAAMENVQKLNRESLKIQERAMNHSDVNGKGRFATTQNASGTSKTSFRVEDIDSKKSRKAPIVPLFKDIAHDQSPRAYQSDINATANGRSATAKTALDQNKIEKSVVKAKQGSKFHSSSQSPSNNTRVKDRKIVSSKRSPSTINNSAVNGDDLEKQKPKKGKTKASDSSFGLPQESDYEGRQGQQGANMYPPPKGHLTKPQTENANIKTVTPVCQERALVDALGVDKVLKSLDSHDSSQAEETHTANELDLIVKSRPQSPQQASGDGKSGSDFLLQQSRVNKWHKQKTSGGLGSKKSDRNTTLPDKSSSQNGKLGVLKRALLRTSGAKVSKNAEENGASSQSPQNSKSAEETSGNREIRSLNLSPGNGSRVEMNHNLPSVEAKQQHGSNPNEPLAADISTTSGLVSQKTEMLGTLEMAAETNLPPKTSIKKTVRKKFKNILKVNGHDKTPPQAIPEKNSPQKSTRIFSKKKASAPPFEFPQNATTDHQSANRTAKPSDGRSKANKPEGKFCNPAAKRDNEPYVQPLESTSAYKSAATAAAQTKKILPGRGPKKKRPQNLPVNLPILNDTLSAEKMRESSEIKSPLSDREEFTFDVNNNTQTSFEILLPDASSENLPEFKMVESQPLALTIEQSSVPSLPRPTTLQPLSCNMDSKQDVQMPDALSHIQKGLLSPRFQVTGLSPSLSPNQINWDPTEGSSEKDIQSVPYIEEEESNKALGNPGASVESIDDSVDAQPQQPLQLEATSNLADSGLHKVAKPRDSSGFVLDGDRKTGGENMKEKRSLPETWPGCNQEEGGIVATAETTLASVSVCDSQQFGSRLNPGRKQQNQHPQKGPGPDKRKQCQPAQTPTIKPLPWPRPANCKSPEASLRPRTEPTLQKQNEPPGKELRSKENGSLTEEVDDIPNPPVQTAPNVAAVPLASFDVAEDNSELVAASISEEKTEDKRKMVTTSDEETPPTCSTTAEDGSQLEDVPDSPGEEDLLMSVVNTEPTLVQGAEDFVFGDHPKEDDAECTPAEEIDTHLLPLVQDERKPLSTEETGQTLAEHIQESGALGGSYAAGNIHRQPIQLPRQSETNDSSELGATGGAPVQQETGPQKWTQPAIPVMPLGQEEINHSAFSVAEQILSNVAIHGPSEHPGRENMQQFYNQPMFLPEEGNEEASLVTERVNLLQETEINSIQDQALGPNRQLQNQQILIHGGDAVANAASEAIFQPLEIGTVSVQEGAMMMPMQQHEDEVLLQQSLENLADASVEDNIDVNEEAEETEDEIRRPVPEPEFPPEAKEDGNLDEVEDADGVHFSIQEQVGPPEPVAPLSVGLGDLNPIMTGVSRDRSMAAKEKIVSNELVCKRRCYVCHGWEALGYFDDITFRFYCIGCYLKENADEHKKAFSSQSNYFQPRKRVCAYCYHSVITRSPIVCDKCGKYFCQIQCHRVHECHERTVWTWED